MRCAAVPSKLRNQTRNQLVESAVGQGLDLGIGSILDRVLDEDPRRIRSQGPGLRLGRVAKHARGDEHRRNASLFEIGGVVHTARRARPSVGQRLDHCIAALGDLLSKIDRRHLGEGRLREAKYVYAALR